MNTITAATGKRTKRRVVAIHVEMEVASYYECSLYERCDAEAYYIYVCSYIIAQRYHRLYTYGQWAAVWALLATKISSMEFHDYLMLQFSVERMCN